MSVFSNYERQVCTTGLYIVPVVYNWWIKININFIAQAKSKSGKKNLDVSEALQTIELHCDKQFVEDLPFYILVLYRIHCRPSLYMCAEMNDFIDFHVKVIEELKHTELAQVFDAFVKQ